MGSCDVLEVGFCEAAGSEEGEVAIVEGEGLLLLDML